MINISVPESHPLTDFQQAIGCVTVIDVNNQECGIYPTVDRAMKYVRDLWIRLDVDLIEVNKDYWHVKIDGKITYRIKRTYFRY